MVASRDLATSHWHFDRGGKTELRGGLSALMVLVTASPLHWLA